MGCLFSAPTFGLGGSSLWHKEEAKNISGNNMKRRSISMKVDFYEVFLSYIIYFLFLYFMTILTLFFPDRFVVSLLPEERIIGSIVQKDSSWKR